MVYRNIRLSDLILYGLVAYSLINIREYKDLFKSRSFLLPKIILGYFLFEFAVSAIRYGFNPIEYFFRLKGLWTSLLIFPFMLLIKRGGIEFLIKIVFPIAVISNLLYILSALTGIPFLPDVSVIKQRLPGDIEVFRVFGGTFYGEFFFFGFVYYWITKKFKLWQLLLSFVFIIPHILSFGRRGWLELIFTVLLMVAINFLNKRSFRILFKHAFLLAAIAVSLCIFFILVIPESDFYVDALKARIFQGQQDVKYDEGTYGTRVISQNAALVNLWSDNDLMLGIGMHPMWVVGAESREESLYYSAFCDVGWPSVLAAYGLVGFTLALLLQIVYTYLSLKMLKRTEKISIYTFFLTLLLAKLLFDSVITFSYVFLSTGLWGFFINMNIYIPIFVYIYEKQRKEGLI
jgi:hypothetical protein